MLEKKNFVINCDVCDARKVDEESLAQYEQICINADGLVVDARSKAVLNRLPVKCNVDFTVELEDGMEVNVESYNGNYEIGKGEAVDSKCKSVLCVNGNLTIKPDAKESLEHYLQITVNGNASYPESLSGSLVNMTVNGSRNVYPDDCILLKQRFVIDKYFPLRARNNGKYFARKAVILTDINVNAALLSEKNVHFETEKLVVCEEQLEDAILLVNEDVELAVVPAGYDYIGENVTLSEEVIAKYGRKLYIDGNLTLNKESTPYISGLEQLHVEGKVELLADQVAAFQKIGAEYKEMKITKGRILKNKAMMTLDGAMLNASSDGVELRNCAMVKIDAEVSSEQILHQLQLQNCAIVTCTPEQRGAVEMVSVNVAKIRDGSEADDDTEECLNIGGQLKKMLASKIVNADKYIL